MRVLIISNDANYSSFLNKNLSAATFHFAAEQSLDGALKRLQRDPFDAVICCLPLLNQACPFEIVKLIQKVSASSRIILICDYIPLHQAMNLIREGVYSGFVRPFPLEELVTTLTKMATESALTIAKAPTAMNAKKAVLSTRNYVKGESLAALKMYEQIELVGPTNFGVIVYGETGTGKESVAQMIATASEQRSAAPYIAVDCGCLSKELALSELFGHEKGSFTGAVSTKAGAFELANNGTIFLDEIGNLDYEVQGFLLRAIQEKKIKRLGGVSDINVNTRIIVASNENLATAVQNGTFREDLFHRLNEFKITVPPLRMRTDDLHLFIEKFLQEANAELEKNVGMPKAETLSILMQYNWPGNVRELRNVMRRSCLLCPDGQVLSNAHLPAEIVRYVGTHPEAVQATSGSRVYNAYVKARDLTLHKLNEALKLVNYNKTKAAELLGIDRKTIYNKLKGA